MKITAAFLLVSAQLVIRGLSVGFTSAAEDFASRSDVSACLPQLIDCSAKVLTAPLNGTFLHYCFVSSYPGNGAIGFSWKRHNGQLDSNRTQINSSGTNYLKNISILIYNIKEHDEDTYVLTVWNHCGARNSSIYVIVNPDGGCNQDQPPNATHIISNRNYYFEGEQIHIFCDFNGDVNLNDYDVEWNKDDQKDITNFFTAGKKYKSCRQSNCPVESSCCSYHDFLTVTNTSKNDSGVYTCLAWPVVTGTPRGNNLSIYVWVAPLPQLLEQPKNVRVKQGESVELSCKVSGFANVTVVQWMKNHIDLESDTGSSEYTIRRENVADDEFVETLQFVASSTAFGGNYSCCLGVRNASSDRTVSTTITRPTTQPGEFDCGVFYGVVSVTGNDHTEVYIGLAAGVTVAIVLLMSIIGVICFVNQRRRGKTTELQVLIDGDSSPGSYGTVVAGNNLLNGNYPSIQAEPGISWKATPWVYILYALELTSFSDAANGDSSAYNLIVDFARLLGILGISCHYDADESSAMNPNTVEECIKEAQLVVVVCSEVMRKAFSNAFKNIHVQMKFSQFSTRGVRNLVSKFPEKFIAVVLAGDSQVCKMDVLQSQRSYDLRNFEHFLRQLKGDTQGRATALLAQRNFRELKEFVEVVRSLV